VTLLNGRGFRIEVPVGNQPNALAVNSATNKVYVANTRSRKVTVIDGASLATTPVTGTPAPALWP